MRIVQRHMFFIACLGRATFPPGTVGFGGFAQWIFGSCVFFREQTSLRSLIHFGPCGAVGDGARAANSCRWDGHRCGPRGRPAATGGGFSRWIFLGRLELQILIYLEGREKSTTKNPPRPKTVEKKSTATKNTTQNTPTFRFLVAAQLEVFHSYACERCGAHPRT